MPYSLTTVIWVINTKQAVIIEAFLKGIELKTVNTIADVPCKSSRKIIIHKKIKSPLSKRPWSIESISKILSDQKIKNMAPVAYKIEVIKKIVHTSFLKLSFSFKITKLLRVDILALQ